MAAVSNECNAKVRRFADIEERQLLGLDVHAATMDQVLALCRAAAAQRRPLSIGVVNAAKLVNMQRETALREAVESSDLILADGMSVVWASRVLGRPLPERVAGIDLFERLIDLAEREGLSVYFLGAEADVLDRAIRVVRERHPRLRIAGSHHGYFGAGEEEQLAGEIGASSPDFLFIGMTSPKKEIFLARWGDQIGAAVCHGVGGSFDVIAGKVRRAPVVWQRLGLEWLYRLLQEPRRLWRRYLVTNTVFAWLVVRELFGRPVQRA
jgi:N-acetylglucosaminyldiphosphoundecaprenol N-acetyl-beta-D-mannosaminyltransferase